MKKITIISLTFISKIVLFSILLYQISILYAQESMDGFNLIQSFFYDATKLNKPFYQPGLDYEIFDMGYLKYSTFNIGLSGGYPMNDRLDLLGNIHYRSLNYKEFDNKSGLTDLDIFGRYQLLRENHLALCGGGFISLPIGSEDIGEGSFDLGIFGTLRVHIQSELAFTSTIGLFSEEKNEKRESLLYIGTGVIYPINPGLAFIGEITLHSRYEDMRMGFGADYNMQSGRIRGGLELGLANEAPKFGILLRYLRNL